MRVVAGTARGRALQAPPGRATRPTSDRVREAVFSMLTSMDAIAGRAVLDLFAGSGALGIEALSRGAARAVFVDQDPGALAVVRANLAVLGDQPAPAASVVRAEAVGWAASAEPVDVAFLDPPYAFDRWALLLGHLAGRAGVVVAETGGPWVAVPGWETLKGRRYGGTVVTLVIPATRPGLSE